MNINKYTEKAQEAILSTQQLTEREGHAEVLPEHLLLTLLEQKEGVVPEIVRKMNPDPMALAAAVRTELNRLPRAHGASQVGLSARLRQVFTAAEQEAERLKDEYVSTEHLFIAIAAEGGRSRRHSPAAAARHHEGHDPSGHDQRSRLAARDEPEPGIHLSGARTLRPRSHRARAQGQARSGDRPRRRDPARDPGAVPPDEEQPGADRRARRREDGGGRRSRPAHHPPGRSRGPEEQEDRGPRHGSAHRRREVPRRVRGTAQGRAQGSHRFGRPGHPLHRRAPHRRRRRRLGRVDGRVEHAQADAGARRAAHRRRDDDRRVSKAHREGCGARAALPARHRRRAERRGHDQHPPRASRAVRDPSRGEVQGLGARRGRRALASLHHGSIPAGQGDRPHRRGGVTPAHGDRLHARGAGRGRAPRHAARDRARSAQEGNRQGVERAPAKAREGARGPEGTEGGAHDAVAAGKRSDPVGAQAARAARTGPGRHRPRAARRGLREGVRTSGTEACRSSKARSAKPMRGWRLERGC